MATNQFTIYTSSDPYGPGPLTGTTGSLVTVLDACLVNGYGTGIYTKPSAGWFKPLPNSGSATILSNSFACYQQGTGSGFTLFVNDSGTNGGWESWVTGWETMSLLVTPNIGAIPTGSVGVGLNQFPTPALGLVNGHVTVKKSATSDTVLRPWIVAADAATMYMWVLTGNSVGTYFHWSFGDCYSLAGPNDLWNCYIYARHQDNGNTFGTSDTTDAIYGNNTQFNANFFGHFLARTGFGSGQCIQMNRRGESAVSQNFFANSTGWPQSINGLLSCPQPDGTYYISPLWLNEVPVPNSVFSIRGRFRGLYQVCHPYTNFADGQFISGSGDYAGKVFMIIRASNQNSFWALETSPTLEFN